MSIERVFEGFANQCNGNWHNMEKTLIHGDWLPAWKPHRYSAFKPGWSDHNTARLALYDLIDDVDEKGQFLRFIFETLLKADPTSDHKYFQHISRWFRFGLKYEECQEIANIISTYEDIKRQYPDISSDPYQMFDLVNKSEIRRNKIKKDPLVAAMSLQDIKIFLDRHEKQKMRAENFISFGAPRHIKEDDVVFCGEDFCLYKAQHMDRWSVTVELANGSLYRIYTKREDKGYFLEMRNEDNRRAMAERLFRDFPAIVPVLAPIFVDRIDRDEDAFIAFAHSVLHAGIGFSFEKGLLARAVQTKYNREIETYNISYADEDKSRLHDYELDRLKRERSQVVSRLKMDLLTLSAYKKERALINEGFFKEVFAITQEIGVLGIFAQAMPVINSVREWRAFITTDHVSAILEQISGGSEEEGRHILAPLIRLIATTPHWRDGNEAEYLPEAISHILNNRDFKSLKTILVYATRQDDPISRMWREALPHELRERIEDFSSENLYKYHHIDILMQRLRNLDKGNTRMFKLQKTPLSLEAIEYHDQRSDRKRQARANSIGSGPVLAL